MAAPLSWIRKIASEVPELNEIPLFGKAPPFNWQQFSQLLASQFAVSRLSIQPREQTWRETEEIGKGLGKELLTYPIVITPIGTLFWIMSQEDMMKFTSWMLKPQAKSRALTSDILQEGFYRFLLLEALSAAQSMPLFQKLTLHLSEEEQSLDEKAFCIDLELSLDERACWGRLVIPAQFRKNWVHHFEQMPTDYVPTDLATQIELVVGVKTGSVALHQEEWGGAKVGDVLLPDRGSYDARNQTGTATLCVGSTPIFTVKIHHNKLSIIDYAFYYEETMEQKQPPQTAEGEVVSLKELPLYLTVELARLKMSLDQLMQIQPGNTLELPIHPDQSVSLTVNGQKVGRAELVYIGETLGLRILEIG